MLAQDVGCERASDMTKIKIVFVENDLDFLATRKEILEEVGLEVIPASTLAVARSILSRVDIDLAILDIRLENDDDEKDVTGLLLAAEEAFLSIPKIMLTGYPHHEYIRLALDNVGGRLPLAVDFVPKQEGPEALLASITKVLATIMLMRHKKSSSPHAPPREGREIFLVHGHDEEAKLAVALFIIKLGLIPIVLSEMSVDGGTIIEQIEKHGEASFAIVIMTPDDFGGSKRDPKKINSRARQNVIFEMGYFMGRLKRTRVRVLCKEGVEILSDFHGVLYIPLDSGDGWKLKLARELRASGFRIDLNDAV